MRTLLCCVVAMAADAANAAPAAIQCDTIATSMDATAIRPMSAKRTSRSRIYLIDDAARSLQEYDLRTGSVANPCAGQDCRMAFGSDEITYQDSRRSPGSHMLTDFALDRMAGTVELSTSLVSRTLNSTSEEGGTCRTIPILGMTPGHRPR